MAATRIISIVGKQAAGKTTLIAALAAELNRRKFRVMILKDGPHAADLDQRGKDTVKESDPIVLAKRAMDGADIVLAEGFVDAPLPKIEVYRLVCGRDPLYSADREGADQWVAMVTDNSNFRAPFPVFRFSDTSWLVTIASLAWDRARILPP